MSTLVTRTSVPVPKDGHLYVDPRRGCAEGLIPTEMPSNPAVSLVELGDGDLLAALFAGSDEGNPDICIWQSRFDSASGRWGPAQQVTDDDDRAEQNPALYLLPSGELWLLYPAQLARRPGRVETFNLQHSAEIRRKVSTDGGRTWSEHEVVFSRPGSFARQPVQVLASGRWLYPNWICFDDDTKNGSDITVIQVSDDQGASWRPVEVPDSQGAVHANVVELGPGHLVALYRSRHADRVYRSESHDDGGSWTAPEPTVLPNNNSSISAVRLPSGRLAVAYNEQSFNEVGGPVWWPFERSSVTVAVSDDGGHTWPWRRVVEFGDGCTGESNLRSNHRYEYPALLVGRDGTLHCAYSYFSRECIKHVVFTEDWVYGTAQVIDGDCKLWS